MTFQERFNLIPPCLRHKDPTVVTNIGDCVLGSISHYIELLLALVAITAFFYIIYAGIQMATAFGNESKYTAAKNTLTYAFLGIIVATLAYTIVSFVTGFFGLDAPKVYDNQTGEEVSNNPRLVTSKIAIREEGTNPGTRGLTEDEIGFADGGTFGQATSIAPNGGWPHGALYLINEKNFTAQLILSNGETRTLAINQLPASDGRYWTRAWLPIDQLRGGRVIIRQHDEGTGYEHTKEVKID